MEWMNGELSAGAQVSFTIAQPSFDGFAVGDGLASCHNQLVRHIKHIQPALQVLDVDDDSFNIWRLFTCFFCEKKKSAAISRKHAANRVLNIRICAQIECVQRRCLFASTRTTMPKTRKTIYFNNSVSLGTEPPLNINVEYLFEF